MKEFRRIEVSLQRRASAAMIVPAMVEAASIW
jgi:hypothetical protein